MKRGGHLRDNAVSDHSKARFKPAEEPSASRFSPGRSSSALNAGLQRQRTEKPISATDVRDRQCELAIDLTADAAQERDPGQTRPLNTSGDGQRRDRRLSPHRLESWRSRGLMPWLILCCTASTTTMASSTTIPIASTRAEHAGHVDRESQQRKQSKRADDRNGNRQKGN